MEELPTDRQHEWSDGEVAPLESAARTARNQAPRRASSFLVDVANCMVGIVVANYLITAARSMSTSAILVLYVSFGSAGIAWRRVWNRSATALASRFGSRTPFHFLANAHRNTLSEATLKASRHIVAYVALLLLLHATATAALHSGSLLLQVLGTLPLGIYLYKWIRGRQGVARALRAPQVAASSGPAKAKSMTVSELFAPGITYLSHTFVFALFLTEIFAVSTTVFYRHGVATVQAGFPELDALQAAEQYYFRSFLEAIPILDIPETLHWELGPTYEDWRVGLLLVFYKVVAITPILVGFAASFKSFWEFVSIRAREEESARANPSAQPDAKGVGRQAESVLSNGVPVSEATTSNVKNLSRVAGTAPERTASAERHFAVELGPPRARSISRALYKLAGWMLGTAFGLAYLLHGVSLAYFITGWLHLPAVVRVIALVVGAVWSLHWMVTRPSQIETGVQE